MPLLYQQEGQAPFEALQAHANQVPTLAQGDSALQSTAAGIVWTPSMRRMYTLLDR